MRFEICILRFFIMSYTRRVAYNTTIQIIGKVITTLISLFLVAALTRYLGVAGYGQYTTIFAFTQFFAVIADFGFFWFLVREISKPNAPQKKIVNNVLTFRTLIALFIFSLTFLIGFFIPQYHDIRYGIGIIAAASFWLTLNGTYVGIFQNRLRMDKAALTDVLGRLAILGGVFFLIGQGTDLNHILWAYFAGNMVNFFLSAYMGRIYVHFRPTFDFDYWREIFRETLPIFLVSVLALISFKIDTVMLSLMRSSIDVGIYGPPYKVVEILILLPGIFMGNVFPILTAYIYSKDLRLESAFQKSFDFLVVIAIPIVVGVIMTAQRIIRIVAGPEFVGIHTIPPVFGIPATSSFALQILIVAVGLAYLSHLFSYMIIALGKQTKMIVPNIIFVVFNVGLNLILIPKISYIGAAMVTILTEIIVVTIYWWLMRRYIDLKINIKTLLKVVLSGIILGLVLYFLRFLNLVYLVPIGIIVYIASLYLLKAVSKEMVVSLIRAEKGR